MAIPFSKQMLIERIRKYLNDGFINDSFSTSDNEILLHIDQAIAFQIVGLAYQNAKIEGALAVAEAFLITYNLTNLSQDPNTGYWFTTLPQPPLSLPLGYSINRVYFANTSNGISEDATPIKAKRLGYRNNMPFPTGIRYWVENNIIWLAASNNYPLFRQNIFVQMPSSRTTDLNAPMSIPDDIIDYIFNTATMTLSKKFTEPRDVVKDYLPSGNNNLKS